jgi:hypothetical protein
MPRRYRSSSAQRTPLGSLTQPGAKPDRACDACGSRRVTLIAIELTDGSVVDFASCHECEHRRWLEQGEALPVQQVLHKSRKAQ